MKKRKIDFVIEQDDNERLIFRFYPRQSYCHSFNDIPPKSWSEVYKVYYSYSILKQYKFHNNDDLETETIVEFEEFYDECSIIDNVGYICQELSKGNEYKAIEKNERIEYLNNPIFLIGTGTEWIISEKNDYDYYKFCLFKYNNVGYRFYLHKYKIEQFGEYLEYCCEYMLKNGCKI